MPPTDKDPRQTIQEEIETDLARIQQEAFDRFMKASQSATESQTQAPKDEPPTPHPALSQPSIGLSEARKAIGRRARGRPRTASTDTNDSPEEAETPHETLWAKPFSNVFSGIDLGRDLSHTDALMPRDLLRRDFGKPDLPSPLIQKPVSHLPLRPRKRKASEDPMPEADSAAQAPAPPKRQRQRHHHPQ